MYKNKILYGKFLLVMALISAGRARLCASEGIVWPVFCG